MATDMALSMPATHQRSAICPSRQRLTYVVCSRQIPTIDSKLPCQAALAVGRRPPEQASCSMARISTASNTTPNHTNSRGGFRMSTPAPGNCQPRSSPCAVEVLPSCVNSAMDFPQVPFADGIAACQTHYPEPSARTVVVAASDSSMG